MSSNNVRKSVLQGVVALSVAALLAVLVRQLPVEVWLKTFNTWVSEAGAIGKLAFVFVYIVAAVLFLPGSVLTLGAGFVFGLAWGFALVSTGATLGAGAAFLVARYLARGWVTRRFASSPKFILVDRAVSDRGGKIVFLLRLSPVLPFNALNYLLGLTGVRFWTYFFASWVGMIPGTLLYVYLGYAGRTGLDAAAQGGETNWMKLIYMGLGLIATLAVTIYVTKVARRALGEQTETSIGILNQSDPNNEGTP